MKTSDLRNILSVQSDNARNSDVAFMTIEYLAETIYISYLRHGAIFCEHLECSTPQTKDYWKLGIDAIELSRVVQELNVPEIDMVYENFSLSIYSKNGTGSKVIAASSWRKIPNTIPSNEFETHASFMLNAKAFEVLHSAGKVAQRGDKQVYIQVTAGKLLGVTAYCSTQVTYQGCFSVNDSSHEINFALPYEVIHSFMDYDFQRISFSFDISKREIMIESAELSVLLPWESAKPPSLDALLEEYSTPTQVRTKDLINTIAECANYSAILGASALAAPGASEVTLTGSSDTSAIGISGIYKNKKIGKGSLDQCCEVTVDAIALLDALHEIKGESVSIHFPQEPLTPLQIESDSQLYMFMPRIKEEAQYDPWQQIDEDYLSPHSEVIFQEQNGDNSQLQIIKIEESPLWEHLPWIDLNRYIDGLYLEYQTTEKSEIQYIALIDDNIELHYALIEVQKQLEFLETIDDKQKIKIAKLLKEAISFTTQIIDKNDLGEAYDGEFKKEHLLDSLSKGAWLCGRLYQALNNVTDITYRLELVTD
jgi:hypothetical protein